MAHTLNYWQQFILDKITESDELSTLEVLTDNEKATLDDLDSNSKVSMWRLFVFCIAGSLLMFEKLLDAFYAIIEALVKANRPHNADWYKTKALAFQYGDDLVDSDEYPIIDKTKLIIKQVAIEEGDRKIIIKIATLDGDELVKVDDIDKVNAFVAYMNKVKDAGTVIEIINQDADKLKLEIDFYYDALLVKADGTLILDPSINVVEAAIDAYLKNIDFNGEYEINNNVDYFQKAAGYKKVRMSFVGFKAGLATDYTPISLMYKPLSGYMKLEDLQVNYIAVV
ncbi:MAG TPA: hypothetical protein PK431_01730 [Chitinophagales bacterium]|nr:hypothetical protein [Chitinophagales bacterium]